MTWEINLSEEVEAWYSDLVVRDPDTADHIEGAIEQLGAEGSTAGRPLVDRIKGSKFQNMKELRPPRVGVPRFGFSSHSIRSARRSSS